MLLLELPVELLKSIVAHLDQPSLAVLSRTSQALRSVAEPELYRTPVVTGQRAADLWTRTWDKLVNPFTATAIKRGRLRLTLQAIEEDEDMVVPGLRGAFEAGVFDNLAVLHIWECLLDVDFLAHLLGPRSPIRAKIRHLTFSAAYGQFPGFGFALDFQRLLPFILLLRKYDVEEFQLLFSDQINRPWMANQVEQDDVYESVCLATHRACRIATDWDYISDQLEFYTFLTVRNLEQAVAALPPTLFPFSSLVSLSLFLSIGDGEEVFAIFCSDLFPVLKHVELEGHVSFSHILHEPGSEHLLVWYARRSTYSSSNSQPVKPAEQDFAPRGQFPFLPQWRDLDWSPLTSAEVASERFAAYKGPELETVDLEKVKMVWPQ
ncbi:hypothetical protein JCM8097_004390 [Rhodosporidiobolus ruineniae]